MSVRTSVASPPAATDRVPRYEGALQGVGNGVALGWVADRSDLQARVLVAVVVDGEIVGEAVADIARPDLDALDLGDGAHGFMVPLPERLQTPAKHRILVLAGPERIAIPAAPSFWHRPSLDGTWSDVVFEPGGALSARVPDPPPRPRKALVAKGWLCDADELATQGPVSEDRIDRIVAVLGSYADACAELGIAYVPALIPRKRDVLSGAPAGERAWIEQLTTRLRDLDHVELLDLLPVLRDAACYGSAYHRTDADWNDRGAFFVARALLKEAHKRVPALRPPALADLHLRQVPAYRGTLADVPKVQLLAGELVPCELEIDAEHGVVIDPSDLYALRMPVEHHLAEAGSTHLRVYTAPAQDDHARLALIGDCAALALVPWIAERASRTTFFWADSLPLNQLELELPPVVVQLVREADLHSGRLPAIAHGAPPGIAHGAPPAELTRGSANGMSPKPQPNNGVSPKAPPSTATPAIRDPSRTAETVPPTAAAAPLATAPPAAAPPATASLPAEEPLAARAGGPELASSLSRPAPPVRVARVRDSAMGAGRVLRANIWTIALVGLLTALSWPFTNVMGGPGLDNSWEVGLNMAVAQGLAFGQQAIFTYGPLGFSYFPAAITPGTFLAAELLGGLIQLALVAVLLASLRRRMGWIVAVVLTLIAASIEGWVEAEPLIAIAFGLVALTLTTPAHRAKRAFRMLAIGGGALAGFALLVKLNDGVAASTIVAVGLLGSDERSRNLAVAAGSLLGTLLALWLIVGEPLGSLPDYLRNGYQVIVGYVEAMGDNEVGSTGDWQIFLVLGSAVALGVGAWNALSTARLRQRAALTGAVVLVHYFLAREIFVRYDCGHVVFLALLVPVALMIPWTRAQRATGVALACMLALATFMVLGRPVGEIVDPLGHAHQLVYQMRDVLHPDTLIAEGRKDVRDADGVPPSIVRALRGHCVNAEPDEIAAVWAHPAWRWCPLPVFQSYTAYTPHLDRLNAAAYADARHGPDRVLRQVDSEIDESNPIWESPAAMLSLLCHFTEIAQEGEWQALARVPNRCGAPYTLAVIHSSLRRTIALPSPPANAVMVAAIDGVQVAGWERLETLFTRAAPRYVTVNGTSDLKFRVPPGTAADGLILWVPHYADYAAPFNLNMNPHTLRIAIHGHRSGSITVRLFAVPIAHPK
jgi:SGNH hydrolase-like domain, acetyltransferase AlgX